MLVEECRDGDVLASTSRDPFHARMTACVSGGVALYKDVNAKCDIQNANSAGDQSK